MMYESVEFKHLKILTGRKSISAKCCSKKKKAYDIPLNGIKNKKANNI